MSRGGRARCGDHKPDHGNDQKEKSAEPGQSPAPLSPLSLPDDQLRFSEIRRPRRRCECLWHMVTICLSLCNLSTARTCEISNCTSRWLLRSAETSPTAMSVPANGSRQLVTWLRCWVSTPNTVFRALRVLRDEGVLEFAAVEVSRFRVSPSEGSFRHRHMSCLCRRAASECAERMWSRLSRVSEIRSEESLPSSGNVRGHFESKPSLHFLGRFPRFPNRRYAVVHGNQVTSRRPRRPGSSASVVRTHLCCNADVMRLCHALPSLEGTGLR